MKNEFDDNEISQLLTFMKAGKNCVNAGKISPSFLLYLISTFPSENKQNIHTKMNKMLLRDLLPKKKRIHLDFLIKKFEKEI